MVRLATLFLLAQFHWVSAAVPNFLHEEKCRPKQVHLAVGGKAHNSMMVSFSSPKECSPSRAYVLLGSNELALSRLFREQDSPTHYNYTSPQTGSFYSSDLFHHILVDGLSPNTTYYYQCALLKSAEDDQQVSTSTDRRLRYERDGNRAMMIRGKTMSFKTAPRPGAGLGHLKFAFVGDVGLKPASNATIHHMARDHDIDSVLLVGDVSYANTVQTKWDLWFDMMENLVAKVPLQTAPGNHEIEIDGETNEIFVPFDSRFSMPQIRPVEKSPTRHATYNGGSNLPYNYGNAFFAYTYGAARFIVLSSFSETSHDSKQYLWLKQELHSIDRAVTPWVFVSFHVPLYNTFGSHNPSTIGKAMKDNMEHLFVYYRVNLVLSGHVHAYMRSHNIAYGYLNQTGPQYIIIGDGGFGNGSSYEHVPAEDWVAKRDSVTHGYGTIELLNATHAHWKWVRNVNENFTTIHDHAYIHNQIFL